MSDLLIITPIRHDGLPIDFHVGISLNGESYAHPLTLIHQFICGGDGPSCKINTLSKHTYGMRIKLYNIECVYPKAGDDPGLGWW